MTDGDKLRLLRIMAGGRKATSRSLVVEIHGDRIRCSIVAVRGADELVYGTDTPDRLVAMLADNPRAYDAWLERISVDHAFRASVIRSQAARAAANA